MKRVFHTCHYVLISHSLFCPLDSHHCLCILLSGIPISSTLSNLSGYVSMPILLNIPVVFNSSPLSTFSTISSFGLWDFTFSSFLQFIWLLLLIHLCWLLFLHPNLNSDVSKSGPRLSFSDLLHSFSSPQLTWHHHALDAQIFLSSPDLSPQLHIRQPAA